MRTIILLLLLFLPGSAGAQTYAKVTATNASGALANINATSFATARQATSATDVYGTASQVLIGLYSSGAGDFRVSRPDLAFALPAMSACSACTLFVNMAGDYSTTDAIIKLFPSTAGASLTAPDFSLFTGWASGAAVYDTTGVLTDGWSTANYAAGWIPFIFNATGRTWAVSKGGTTARLKLLSHHDYDGLTGGGAGFQAVVQFTAMNVSAPYLSLTYTPAATDNRRHAIRNGVMQAVIRNVTIIPRRK